MINEQTVTKYTALIDDLDRRAKISKVRTIVRKHNVSSSVFSILTELKYLKRLGHGNYEKTERFDSTESRKIAVNVIKRQNELITNSMRSVRRTARKKAQKLSEASIPDIVAELKHRGYTGIVEPIQQTHEF